ncbi:MAG: SDR family oxidoreductase [Bacteroidales bacterium]|nr:SDR family oxidoreductase [Bacteroidales bacterium]
MFFKDKIVWITGASSGVGEAMVYAFNNERAKLIISSHEPEELKRVKNNCKFEPENIFILPFNLREHDKFPGLVKTVIEKFKKVDILFNIGGVSQRSLAKDTIPEVDKRIMDINYFGTVLLTKALLPEMIKNKSGHIAAMSSLAGKFEIPLRTAYAASKHALHGFFDTLRAEVYEDNIKITLFCPAYINTKIAINALTEDGSSQNINDPGAAKGTSPDDFAQLALKAIKKGKHEVISGGKEILGVYIKRFSPKLFSKIIRKRDVR